MEAQKRRDELQNKIKAMLPNHGVTVVVLQRDSSKGTYIYATNSGKGSVYFTDPEFGEFTIFIYLS